MYREVQKVLSGNRITLPKNYAESCGIKEGDFVIVEGDGQKLTVIPAEVREMPARRNFGK